MSVLLLLVTAKHSIAQDDTIKGQFLNEVIVQDPKNSNQFNFFKSSRLTTTEEILNKMQGVNLIRRGNYGLEPVIRNYSAGQINLTIDGMRMYGACTDRMDPVSVYVEPGNLDEIQVKQGASGSQTGSSTGGSINMGLKLPGVLCHPENKLTFSQQYGTNNHYNSSGLIFERNSPHFGLRVSGVYRKAGNYRSGKDSLVDQSGFEKYNLNLATVWQPDSSNAFRFTYLYDLGLNIGYPALPMDVGSAKATIASVSYLRTFRRFKSLKSETKIYLNRIYHKMDDTHRDNVPMHMDMPGWSKTEGAYHEITYKKNQRHFISSRLDYHHNFLRADMTMYPRNGDPEMYMQTLPNSHLKDAGWAFNYSYAFNKRIKAGANFRIDHTLRYAEKGIGADLFEGMGYSILKNRTNMLKSFGLDLRTVVTKSISTQLILSHGERLPTANEMFGFYLFNRVDGFDYIGNPDLKTEKSNQVEIRIEVDLKKVHFFIQPFYHHNPDYIYAYYLSGYSVMTPGARGVKSYTNISYARSAGFEAGLRWKFNDRLNLISSFRYVNGKTNSGQPLPLTPPFKNQSAIRYSRGLLNIQAENEYSFAQNRINNDFHERKTPAYTLFNLRISRSFRTGKHSFQALIAAENLLNSNYFDHLDVGYVPRIGRTFVLGITFNLDCSVKSE